jgi:hypothetical protein
MRAQIAWFPAVMLTALALVPSGAHFFEPIAMRISIGRELSLAVATRAEENSRAKISRSTDYCSIAAIGFDPGLYAERTRANWGGDEISLS